MNEHQQEQQRELDAGKDTAVTDLAAFAAEVEMRRRELGIVQSMAQRPPIRAALAAMPDKPRLPERDLALEERRLRTADQLRKLDLAAGRRYATCRLDNFNTTQHRRQVEVLGLVREYCDSIHERYAASQGVVLFGPVGTGKDHLAYCIARAGASLGMTVRWMNGQNWFGSVRDAMDEQISEELIVNRISRPALIVISDPLPPFGKLSQHQATMLYRAIDARYAAKKPTIVTVNVADDDEADERIGAAIWDRMCHDAWKISCQWRSARKPAREVSQ